MEIRLLRLLFRAFSVPAGSNILSSGYRNIVRVNSKENWEKLLWRMLLWIYVLLHWLGN